MLFCFALPLLMAMTWTTLRKGGTGIHLSYESTFTNNLRAYDVRHRSEPQFEISIDLNRNLRTRNKTTNDYLDARDLAKGRIRFLQMLQISDDRIIEGLKAA